jgi:hypothetical protein
LNDWNYRARQFEHTNSSTMALQMTILRDIQLFCHNQPHDHIRYLLLNCIVKRIVEKDLYLEKLEQFADFFFALTTTRVQMQPVYFRFFIS